MDEKEKQEDNLLYVDCVGLAKQINEKIKSDKRFYESSLGGIVFGFIKKKLDLAKERHRKEKDAYIDAVITLQLKTGSLKQKISTLKAGHEKDHEQWVKDSGKLLREEQEKLKADFHKKLEEFENLFNGYLPFSVFTLYREHFAEYLKEARKHG